MNFRASKQAAPSRVRWGLWLLLSVITVLAGAACPPQDEERPDPCADDPNSQACVCSREPDSELCACLTEPGKEGCLCVLEPGREECNVPPCENVGANEHTTEAVKLLSDGQWEEGRLRIQCALAATPNYRRALKIKDQLDSDPEAYLQRVRGKRSVTYAVQRSDTLGSIAKRCLGDTDLFVALARLNQKERPSALLLGERLRIVGTASCAETGREDGSTSDSSDALRRQALRAEQSGEFARAYGLISRSIKLSPNDAQVADDLKRIRTAYLQQLRDQAYEMQDGGQAAKARALWQRALEIDPANVEARLNLKDLTE